jgi:hypothetical protein
VSKSDTANSADDDDDEAIARCNQLRTRLASQQVCVLGGCVRALTCAHQTCQRLLVEVRNAHADLSGKIAEARRLRSKQRSKIDTFERQQRWLSSQVTPCVHACVLWLSVCARADRAGVDGRQQRERGVAAARSRHAATIQAQVSARTVT